MTIPLILQIQQAALDSQSSVTDALRKAKVACTKLGLGEFGNWVDRELNGYMGVPGRELPKYRILNGTPEAYNPYHGWQPIIFPRAKSEAGWSRASIGMSIPAIEELLRSASGGHGDFSYPYNPEAAVQLRKALSFETPVHISLSVPQISEILNVVRNIILEWTMDMEKQGILGTDLTFSEEEREKSAAATAQTINNIHISGQVGSFVQSAESSVVQGGVDAVLNLDRVHQFVEQVEQLLSSADVSNSVKEDTEAALSEVKQVAAHPDDTGKLGAALRRVRQAVAPLGEHLFRIGVDAGIDRLPGILS